MTCCGRSSGSASGCSGFCGRRRGRLGDGRQRGQVRVHAGAVTGDDDGVGGQVDVQRLVEGDRRGVGPRLAVGPARRASSPSGFVGIGHQRLAQRDVELHRSGVGGARTRGGHQHPAGRRSPLRVERVQSRSGASSARPEADVRAHLGAEVAQLLHGLVGAGAQQLVGPVGAQHDQRHPRVVGLDHGRARGWPPRCPTSSPRTPAPARRPPARSPGSPRCVRRCGRADAAGRRGRRRAARTPAGRCASPGTARRRGRRRGSVRRRRRGPVPSRGSLTACHTPVGSAVEASRRTPGSPR